MQRRIDQAGQAGYHRIAGDDLVQHRREGNGRRDYKFVSSREVLQCLALSACVSQSGVLA